MKITIHRGANQIGGCVTEIASGKTRVLIDLGSNLPGNDTPDFTTDEIGNLCKGMQAVFYTHYHGDHAGHMQDVPANVAQYTGKAAKEAMRCKYETLNQYQDYGKALRSVEKMKCYYTSRSVCMNGGEIKVTPYFVSHSAADAYMFKIETEGLTILHTGDFRNHGYLGKGLIPTLKKYVKQVDLLIIEGTMLGRMSEIVDHETTIQKKAINLLRTSACKHLFALCSSTDIDRLASFHAACQKTGTLFVCDSYQKKMLDLMCSIFRIISITGANCLEKKYGKPNHSITFSDISTIATA